MVRTCQACIFYRYSIWRKKYKVVYTTYILTVYGNKSQLYIYIYIYAKTVNKLLSKILASNYETCATWEIY